MFGGSEEGLPYYDLDKFSNMISSVWYGVGTGYPLTILLPRIPYLGLITYLNHLGLSAVLLQASTFFIILSTGSVSSYLLAKNTITPSLPSKYREKVALYSGLFYLLNPYSMSQIFTRALYSQMFAYALLPLFLLLVIRGINKNKFVYAIYAVLASFIFAPAFVLVIQVVVIWIPIFMYTFVYLLFHKDRKKVVFLVKYMALLIVLWALVHLWWLIPTFNLGGKVFAVNANNLEENLATLRGVSPHFSLSYILRLMQNFYFFGAKTYGDIYSSLIFLVISWLIPFVAFFSIIAFRKTTAMVFFGTLFIISLFVCLGSNPPFGNIFVWFFTRFTPLQAFRNPYEKFGLVYMLAYTPFFALGLVCLPLAFGKRISAVIRTILLILICVIFVWPMWTGRLGGDNQWTRVPEYYKEADIWLGEQPGDFRIMQMPLISSDGVIYDWAHPYQGIEPGEFLFKRNSIGRNVIVNKVYYDVLLQRFGNFHPGSFGPDPDISESKFRSENLYEELAKLGVRYLVFHNDLEDSYIGGGLTKLDFLVNLEKEEKIRKVNTFGELDIYEVEIPENISILYSPHVNIVYKQVNPALYEGNIDSPNEKEEIDLLELYDSGWELYLDGELQNSHSKVFDYANSWFVLGGKHKIVVKYAPQDKVDDLLKLSLLAVSLIVLLLAFRKFYLRLRKTPSA